MDLLITGEHKELTCSWASVVSDVTFLFLYWTFKFWSFDVIWRIDLQYVSEKLTNLIPLIVRNFELSIHVRRYFIEGSFTGLK